MELDKIFLELQDGFGLKNQHIEILKALQFEALSAEKICDTTKISPGRIYLFLNELLDSGLIQKTPRKPYVYWMENPKEKIITFMKNRFDTFVKNEHRVIQLLEEKENIHHIEHIDTSSQFVYVYMKMLHQCNEVYALAISNSLPFEFYSHNKDDFLKIRNLIITTRPTLAHRTPEKSLLAFQTLQEFFQSKKKYIAVMEKKSFDFHKNLIIKEFGQAFFDKVVHDLKTKMSAGNLKLYVIDDTNPMQLFISDDRVFFSLRHHGETSGVLLRSKDIAGLYMELFNSVLSRAEPIEKYL